MKFINKVIRLIISTIVGIFAFIMIAGILIWIFSLFAAFWALAYTVLGILILVGLFYAIFGD